MWKVESGIADDAVGESGVWRVESGEMKVESGKWKVELRVTPFRISFAPQDTITTS